MIPNDFIQALLSRVDIVEVIDPHLPLKKAGANYVACCPFHNEKSPSFTVSPSKQFYHCFGCGAHGTAIGFLIEYSGMSFPEAVADLARGVGLDDARYGAARGVQRLVLECLHQLFIRCYATTTRSKFHHRANFTTKTRRHEEGQ